ncbi:ComGF family competence protein [Candidatus Vagococcus giribetii]|uniref:ComGF family competence protein n=1 Tax=Candidatus Vagococcus giribetii TaxID=2230876 RepID=UPI0021027C39|nr:ComGF family competence protein [Vagococcus sp. DIV0080]
MGLLIFLEPFLKSMTRVESTIKKSDYLEVQIGKIQLDLERRGLVFSEIKGNQLIYKNDKGENVTFEFYQNMIRKRVSGEGHQPIMTGVKSVRYQEINEVIEMEVTTLEKETYCYFLFPW